MNAIRIGLIIEMEDYLKYLKDLVQKNQGNRAYILTKIFCGIDADKW